MLTRVAIKTFELSDLVGRIISVRSFTEGGTELVVAVDLKTGELFALKEIHHDMLAAYEEGKQ